METLATLDMTVMCLLPQNNLFYNRKTYNHLLGIPRVIYLTTGWSKKKNVQFEIAIKYGNFDIFSCNSKRLFTSTYMFTGENLGPIK